MASWRGWGASNWEHQEESGRPPCTGSAGVLDAPESGNRQGGWSEGSRWTGAEGGTWWSWQGRETSWPRSGGEVRWRQSAASSPRRGRPYSHAAEVEGAPWPRPEGAADPGDDWQLLGGATPHEAPDEWRSAAWGPPAPDTEDPQTDVIPRQSDGGAPKRRQPQAKSRVVRRRPDAVVSLPDAWQAG
ncbi:hypothetical protein N9L68_06380 [bacterium]|nr:hypothetical protein [bacterium]